MAFDVATLGIAIDARPVSAGATELDKLTAASGRAESATQKLTATDRALAQSATGAYSSLREMAEAVKMTEAAERAAYASSVQMAAGNAKLAASNAQVSASARKAATDFATMYDAGSRNFATQYVGSMSRVVDVHGKATGSSKALTQATLNMTRQFADVGVTAAMGMSPLMILIQQGPQIADAFQMAKSQGIGFNAVLAHMWALLSPVLVILAPIAIAVGAVAAGFGLLHRELSKSYPKDITDGMNLTEAQLDRVKGKTVTFGDTVKATFIVIGRHIMDSPIGDALKWLGGAFAATFDWIAKTAIGSAANVVGAFVGAYEGVKSVWGLLPRVMGDIGAQAANAMIAAVEWMVNKSIAGLNKLIALANAGAKAVGVDSRLQTMGGVDFGRVANPDAGAAAQAGNAWGNAAAAGFEKGSGGFRKAVTAFGAEIGAEALKLARKDALKEAGRAAKGSKGAADPRDQTDERTAQIAAMLAQAMADELQSRLALTREIVDRAAIEKQIAAMQAKVKQAQIEREMANITDDKGLSDAKKAELLKQLEIVQATAARTEINKTRLIDEQAAAALAKEALGRQTAERELQIDLLASQGAIAKYGFQRRAIDMQVLKLQQQIERLKLEEIVNSKLSTQAEKDIARARLSLLGIIQANQQKAVDGGLDGAFNNVTNALEQMAAAFKARDWKGVLGGLIEAIGTLRDAFKKGASVEGKIGAVAAVADVIGQAIGGTAGSTLSGAASGAMAGTMILPGIGTAIGAIVGGIAGFLSGSSASKKAKQEAARQAAEAAAQHALEVANQRRQIELNLIALSGDAIATLAAQREAEMAGIDESNRALMRQLYAAQDKKRIEDEVQALQIRYMQATGDEAGILAKQRAEEVKGIDATNRALLDLVYAQEDYALRLSSARDGVSAAYEREQSALKATQEKFQGLAKSIRDFSDGIGAEGSGALSYGAAKRNFLATSSSRDPEVLGGFQSSAQAFLAASKASAATQQAYQRDVALVRNAGRAAEAFALREVTIAEQQLAANTAQLTALGLINASVLTLPAAIAALLAVQATAPTATPASVTPTGPSATSPNWTAYLNRYPDVMAWAQSGHGDPSKPIDQQTLEDRARYHWYNTGMLEGRQNFATGGSFTVGGSGGPDSQNFGPINLSPGEVVNVRKGGDNDNGMSAVAEALQQQNALLKEQNRLLKSLDAREGVRDFQGLYVRGEVPGDPVSTQEAA